MDYPYRTRNQYIGEAAATAILLFIWLGVIVSVIASWLGV